MYAQEGFLDESSGGIRTANFVRVNTKIKGECPETLVIFTEGGRIEGRAQDVSHSAKLTLGEEGIFLLKGGNPAAYNDGQGFELSGGNLGIIRHLKRDREKEGFCPGTGEKVKSWREIREQVGLWCANDLRIAPVENSEDFGLRTQSELCIKLANAIPLFQTQQVQFDIYAKSSVQGLKFEGIELYLDYPTENIDASIVSNGGITVTKQTVIAASIYQLSVQDVTSSKLKIDVGTGCISSLSYYTLDTVYEKLARVVVDVSNWGSIGTLNLESFGVEGTASYYSSPGRCYDFDRVCGEGNVGFVACEVDNIEVAPFADGVGQILTITGQDFGNGILGEITIPNPDDGGDTDFEIFGGPLIQPQYFESWEDDEIKVKLSSLGPGGHPFGSGTWEIDPDVNSQEPNTLVCFVKVEIDYALLNTNIDDVDRMIALAKNPTAGNPDGAHEWYLDAGINNNPALQAQGITFDMVEEVAIAAYCHWENAVGIETRYMGPLANPDNNNDNRNTLMFANLDPTLGGLTNVRFSTDLCDNNFLYFAGRIEESDIRMNTATNWFVSTGINGIQDLEYDFYSVLLHEIGHSIGQFHAMDIDDNNENDVHLMYYRVKDEQIKRNIDAAAELGTELLIQRTLESINTPGQCLNGYVLNTNPVGCAPNAINNNYPTECKLRIGNVVKKGENLSVDTGDNRDKRLSLFNSIGQSLFKNYGSGNKKVEIPTLGLPAGVYFLQYFCNGIPQVEKILIQ